MKGKTIVLLGILVLFCVGCGNSFRSNVLNQANEKGWSEKQRKAAAADAYLFFLKNFSGDGGKSGDLLADTNTNAQVLLPSVKYNLLTLDRLVTRIDQWLEDFDLLLSYNAPEEVRHVDTFGLRPSLTQDEKVMKAVRARVKAAELDRVFKTMIGQIPSEFARIDCLNGYNIRSIFGTKSLTETFKFNVDQIDEARKVGILKLIERSKIQINRVFDHKIKDPNNPGDSNAFVWVPNNQEFELANYKILYDNKPKDNIGNYIEGYRWNNGKRESLPCLKVFMVSTGAPNAVLVIDTKQEDQLGFGVPDLVEERETTVSVNDLIHDQELIARLFSVKPENRRIPPKTAKIYVEIARAEKPIDVWEEAGDKLRGWTVPFHYKNAFGSNYNVRVELSRPGFEATTNPSDMADMSVSRTFEYLKKEWTNGNRFEPSLGQVVEYYAVKPPYDQLKLLSARVLVFEDTKKVFLTKEDGSTENVFVKPGQNKISEDKPIAILYTEGERRYVIKRVAGSAIFSKKKELSTSTAERTGVYEDGGDGNLSADRFGPIMPSTGL